MRYRVIGRVAIIQCGAVLGLDDDQASRREHMLSPVMVGRGKARKRCYTVTGQNVKFKAGEVIDVISGADLSRMTAVFEAIEGPKAKAD